MARALFYRKDGSSFAMAIKGKPPEWKEPYVVAESVTVGQKVTQQRFLKDRLFKLTGALDNYLIYIEEE